MRFSYFFGTILLYYPCMKKHPWLAFIFAVIYTIILALVIVFLCLGKWGISMLCGVPSVFLIPIFLTFYKIPEKTNKHSFLLVMLTITRYLLSLIGILLPAVLWYFIPVLKESANAFLLLVPFVEIILVYNIVAIMSIVESKRQITRMNKKE
jgi:hypothetical protein